MKLERFAVYIDPSHGIEINPIWINEIHLENINLLVGKNASGKTSVLNAIDTFAKIFTDSADWHVGDYKFLFDDDGVKYEYEYRFGLPSEMDKQNDERKKATLIHESLLRDGEELINRNTRYAWLRSEVNGKKYEVDPPEDISILLAHRDRTQFPYNEKIIKWADGVQHFKFGKLQPASFFREQMYSVEKEFNVYLGKLGNEGKKKVIDEFNTLGYNVEMIDFDNSLGQNNIEVKERGLERQTIEYFISQGMFRALWLLLYIDFLIDEKNVSLIMIDDLCEGLDYNRATSLGKLLFNKMGNSNVQFIASSNDSFLMNVVDIEYWNILSREGNTIKSKNYSTHKKQFDKFKRIGLENFDLFTSNFLELER